MIPPPPRQQLGQLLKVPILLPNLISPPQNLFCQLLKYLILNAFAWNFGIRAPTYLPVGINLGVRTVMQIRLEIGALRRTQNVKLSYVVTMEFQKDGFIVAQ